MQNNHRGQGGFTLTQLLVVLGIIAVLIGILLPTISKARESSRVIQCTNNLMQVDLAIKIWSKDRKPAHYAMRMPDQAQWMEAVTSVMVDDKVLYCPSGDQTRPEPGTFTEPVIDYKPNNNHGHPTEYNPFDPASVPRKDRPLIDPFITQYTVTTKYQKNKPETAVIQFNRIQLVGNVWKATVISVDPVRPYGGPPINLTFGGVYHANIQVGQTFTASVVSVGSNYGYNANLANLNYAKTRTIVAMDYPKSAIKYADDVDTDDDPAVELWGRHFKARKGATYLKDQSKFNVLYSDSSVSLQTIKDIDPALTPRPYWPQ